MLYQALQHAAELAAGFARADHVDIKIAKLQGVGGQGAAQGDAAFDVVEQALGEHHHGGFGVHANEHAQGVVQRQAGFEHDGEFAGHDQEVRRGDGVGGEAARALGAGGCGFARAGEVGRAGRLAEAASFGDFKRGQAQAAQLLHGLGQAGGLQAALGDFGVGLGGFPQKIRHQCCPR